jgi:hypothetical protein
VDILVIMHNTVVGTTAIARDSNRGREMRAVYVVVIRSGDRYMFEELSDNEDMDFINEQAGTVVPVDVVDNVSAKSDWRQERHTVGPMEVCKIVGCFGCGLLK